MEEQPGQLSAVSSGRASSSPQHSSGHQPLPPLCHPQCHLQLRPLQQRRACLLLTAASALGPCCSSKLQPQCFLLQPGSPRASSSIPCLCWASAAEPNARTHLHNGAAQSHGDQSRKWGLALAVPAVKVQGRATHRHTAAQQPLLDREVTNTSPSQPDSDKTGTRTACMF